MNNNPLTLWQRLGLKITLNAIPSESGLLSYNFPSDLIGVANGAEVYVLPRACFQYLFHCLSKSRCPSQEDLIHNRVIRW